jgi:hypothetical protein
VMNKHEELTVLQKTYIYLEQYREMKRYISKAVSEISEVENVDNYNVSAEKAFLASIRECKATTLILYTHIKNSLDSLKSDAVAAGEEYKYRALEERYVKGVKEKTYEEISEMLNCGKGSPKRWCNVMAKKLSVKLFGAKAMET